MRHRSQALRTRLRMPSTLSCGKTGMREADVRLVIGEIGDMMTLLVKFGR